MRGTLPPDEIRQLIQDLAVPAGPAGRVLDPRRRLPGAGDPVPEAEHFLFLGRGVNYPVALEGALKLKEISYIHAEGYPAAR